MACSLVWGKTCKTMTIDDTFLREYNKTMWKLTDNGGGSETVACHPATRGMEACIQRSREIFFSKEDCCT